jgi:hypothetical protein
MEEQPEQEFKVGIIRYLIGTTPRNMPRTKDYVEQEWNNIFTRRRLHNATLAWSLYDGDTGARTRTTVIGDEPSREMQRVMEEELGPDPEDDEVIERTA